MRHAPLEFARMAPVDRSQQFQADPDGYNRVTFCDGDGDHGNALPAPLLSRLDGDNGGVEDHSGNAPGIELPGDLAGVMQPPGADQLEGQGRPPALAQV